MFRNGNLPPVGSVVYLELRRGVVERFEVLAYRGDRVYLTGRTMLVRDFLRGLAGGAERQLPKWRGRKARQALAAMEKVKARAVALQMGLPID